MQVTTLTQPLAPSPIRHPKLSEVSEFPRPRFKGHWAIGSKDMALADRFYETLTGSKTICRPAPFSTAVSWDVEHHRFFILNLDDVKFDPSTGKPVTLHPGTPQDRTGIGLASIRYAFPRDLVAVFIAMEASGWLPKTITDRGELVALRYSDPDGLLVEVFAATGGNTASDEELGSEQFIARFG